MTTSKEKVCVITGAAHGLGRALALLLAKKGVTVVASDIHERDLASLSGIARLTIPTNVTKESDVRSLADRTYDTYKHIDLWINNAGVWAPHGPAEMLTRTDLQHVIDVNVYGTIFGSQAAIRYMQPHGGTIVNIVSVSALDGHPFSSGYAASKWAVRGYNLSLRAEMHARNIPIQIISVYPGRMNTNLFDKQKPSDLSSYPNPTLIAEKIVANLEKETPEEEYSVT